MVNVLVLITLLTMCPITARSQNDDGIGHKSFTLYWENDSFTGSDRDYSNGLKLTWSREYRPPLDGQKGIKDWMVSHLPLMSNSESSRATSFSIGQSIFTPEDTDREDLIDDDRPYAGFTYLGFGFVSVTGNRRDVWEFDIGIVGPAAQAEAAQDFVHEIIGVDKARGWDNQLDNELGLNVTYESKWRLWHVGNPEGFSFDLIPHLGGRAGNIAIYANGGAEVRFGWSLPEDFGTCPIRPGCDVGTPLDSGLNLSGGGRSNFGFHLFGAVEGRAVLRNIFLDGNTFQDGHSVDRELLVTDLMAGIAVHYGRFRMNYAYVLRSREFKQQDDRHAFGAISISYLY